MCIRDRAYTKLNALTPLSLSTFDSFDLNYYTREKETDERYSPYDLMERNLQSVSYTHLDVYKRQLLL